MKRWSRIRYWCLDYGEIAFVLSILIISAVIIIWMLVLLFMPRTAVAGDITNFRSARRLAAVVLPIQKVTTRHSEPIKTLSMEISAYSPAVAETDGNPHRTASGKHVYVGGIASDWSVLPCGSIVTVEGYNGGKPCQVVDTGGAIHGNKLDLFFWHESEAIQWGRRRNVKVQVLYAPKAAE